MGRELNLYLALTLDWRAAGPGFRTFRVMNPRRALVAAAATVLTVVAGTTAIAMANGVFSPESNRIGNLAPTDPVAVTSSVPVNEPSTTVTVPSSVSSPTSLPEDRATPTSEPDEDGTRTTTATSTPSTIDDHGGDRVGETTDDHGGDSGNSGRGSSNSGSGSSDSGSGSSNSGRDD